MLSKALSHFPQFRFRDGQKRLWNPILKKTFVNLPEERVRLALIDYLVLEAGFSAHRISFESPVKLEGDKSSSRTDIICYDNDFKPLLLVECKAPEVKLDEKAAIQVARYNQKVGAPYVLVSNGVLDFWFETKKGEVKHLQEVPAPFQIKNKVENNFRYWGERGFIGEKLPPEARAFATNSCKELFGNSHQPIKFLKFDDYSPEFALGHYYRIFGLQENVKVAVSSSANPFGGTRLNTVLNQNGANTAFFSSSIDLIAEGEKVNTEIHSGTGTFEVDLSRKTGFNFTKKITDLASDFYKLLLKHS
ncbi:MAG: type I restriction enzyme HsdR N-terminal domain-containing protein [Gracilimonas sp.]|uniref:type I restriction enzyme HsdR N-terminal domain-containing protein n=1 Tax=Gracilimonas sp. TaxID=1974203 RepID=UPI0019C785C8|nr:type I restriction enzyme HsdR N-terminal domain-containing protein [Gracilimonas sp.]MBD3616845.1 type I restriction enzyme HsdR N-terminal domain-containing protein [Gracilimonas sp.]